MTPQFCDISEWQSTDINWQAYKAWSAQGDGISRVAIRSSYGISIDPHLQAYRVGAIAAGIDQIIYYHYAYPNLNPPQSEADAQFIATGAIRPQDMIVLDFEEDVVQATADWALAWLMRQARQYDRLPGLYASSAYIAARLQNPTLASYPLWLANWQFSPDARPPVPAPWTSYEWVQYTDKATSIPGIPGTVDADIFLGKESSMTTIPTGWTDDGTILTAPNNIPVVRGFRDHVLNSSWDASNWPLEAEHAASPVEESNPSLGAGTAQTFRMTRMAYTASMGIYVSWIGQELQWYQSQLAILQGEIAQLQTLPAAANLAQINSLIAQSTTILAQVAKLSQVQ
jgi:GH25 family lysozyme M1 (1,4-beta-N-acetylmuramidase)